MTDFTANSPASLGYKMPPEWAPHEATWLSWPRRDGISFPHAYEEVIPAFAHMIDALRDSEKVRINVMDVDHENEVRFFLKEIEKRSIFPTSNFSSSRATNRGAGITAQFLSNARPSPV